MRMIRLCKGWKQSTVADLMNITQQAYSHLEQGNSAPRIDTLNRFCKISEIQLNYLLAFELPVTEQSIVKYGSWKFGKFIEEQFVLEQKTAFLNNALVDRFSSEMMETRLIANR